MTRRQPTKERQRQIAEAALAVISRSGISGFTTSAIAQEVGLAEGTIFRHFSNKKEILVAAIKILKERLAESFPDEAQAAEDPLDRLGRFMRHRFALVLAHRGIFQVFFSNQLAMTAGEEGVALMEGIKEESMEFLLQCLREAAEKEQLRSTIAPEFLVRVIQGTVHAFLFSSSATDPLEEQPESIANRTWSSLFELIRR